MKYLKTHKKLIWGITAVVLLLLPVILNCIWLYLLIIIVVLLFWINIFIYNSTAYNARHLFSTIGRNYKRLVIGEMCDVSQFLGEEGALCFLSPAKRSTLMVFELVKRLYSLLDEDSGELYIVIHSNRNSNMVSVFDVPYLHDITLKSLGIVKKKWKSHFPLFFEPQASIKFLFRRFIHNNLVESVCPYSDISSFCRERNIKLRFYYIQS